MSNMLTKRFFKTKDETEVTFEFKRDDVTSAQLVGEFSDWQEIDMKFDKKSQSFKTRIRLPKGEAFQFRYLLNQSEWENDYCADAYVPNEYGSENSVVATQ